MHALERSERAHLQHSGRVGERLDHLVSVLVPFPPLADAAIDDLLQVVAAREPPDFMGSDPDLRVPLDQHPQQLSHLIHVVARLPSWNGPREDIARRGQRVHRVCRNSAPVALLADDPEIAELQPIAFTHRMSYGVRETCMGNTVVHDPIVAQDAERDALKELVEALERRRPSQARLVWPDAHEIAIPPSLYAVLVEALRLLTNGNGVSVLPVTAELATQQAADLLNVSRPFVVKLIEDGTIPFHKAGRHRRISLQDVLTYKARRDNHARDTLQQLVTESQELDVYDE